MFAIFIPDSNVLHLTNNLIITDCKSRAVNVFKLKWQFYAKTDLNRNCVFSNLDTETETVLACRLR